MLLLWNVLCKVFLTWNFAIDEYYNPPPPFFSLAEMRNVNDQTSKIVFVNSNTLGQSLIVQVNDVLVILNKDI